MQDIRVVTVPSQPTDKENDHERANRIEVHLPELPGSRLHLRLPGSRSQQWLRLWHAVQLRNRLRLRHNPKRMKHGLRRDGLPEAFPSTQAGTLIP